MADGPRYLLRAASEGDEEFLRTLHRRCYEDVVVAQFGEWDDQQQRGFFEKKWNPGEYQIVVLDDTDMGAVSIFDQGDHIFLSEIVIDPGFQNEGLGSRIVEDIVARAKSENRPVRLQVLRANKAQNLYLRLGFTEIGRTDTHIKMER